MHITVFDGYRRAHIQSCTAAPLPARAAPARVDLADAFQATRFLRRYFCDDHALTRLRAALAVDLDACAGQGDDDVIRQAAGRIASGAWVVRYDDVAPGAVPVVSRVGKAPGGPARAGRAAPAAPRATAPAPAPTPVVVAAPEWPAAVNQVAQAVTLEQAAVSGTPFCAICAERARARAAAAAADAESPA